MEYDGSYFKCSTNRKAPHNSYISKEHLEDAMEVLNVDPVIRKTPRLSFHPDAESAKLGEIATTVIVGAKDDNFTSTYLFDSQTNLYDREVNGIITIDKANDKKVTPAILFQNGIALELECAQVEGVIMTIETEYPQNLFQAKYGFTWYPNNQLAIRRPIPRKDGGSTIC